MIPQRTCIVEVTEVVPAEEVPFVAARVAERLAMPVERVRKLIDARTGPITRPLRPDKAEAIAQTFEAAGVVVAIRPTTEDDEVEPERPAAPPEAARTAPPEAGDAETDAREPTDDTAAAPEADHEAEAESAAESGADTVPDAETDEEAEAGATPPEPASESDRRTPRPGAPLRIEPEPEELDDELDELGQDGLPARGEVRPRPRALVVEVTPAAVELEDEHDPVAAPRDGGAPEDKGAPEDQGAPEEDAVDALHDDESDTHDDGDQRRPPTFTDEDSWATQDEDPDGGWVIVPPEDPEPEDTEELEADTVDAEPDVVELVVDEATVASSAERPEGLRPGFAPDPTLPWSAEQEPETDPEAEAGAEHDPAADETFEHAQVEEAPDEDTQVEAAAVEFEDPVVAMPPAGETPITLRTPWTPPAPSTGTEPRRVPTAWRGLGDAPRGPARPPEAPLPRRGDPLPGAAPVEAQRVITRRVVLLALLLVAVVALAITQFWASGRAAGGYEAGLHRFRDGQFAAARAVWSRQATAGDANAQFMLGYMSETGLGQSWSARAAASWYRLAADQGHTEAQWRLGSLYARGLGVPWDPPTARHWWALASAGGHGEAAFMLGRALFEEPLGPDDAAQARVAFERAATLGWRAADTYVQLLSVVSDEAHGGALP
jgi:hypothetical protein